MPTKKLNYTERKKDDDDFIKKRDTAVEKKMIKEKV